VTATSRLAAILLIIAVVLGACTAPSSAVGTDASNGWQPGLGLLTPIVAEPGFRGEFADPFLGDVAARTWKYLRSDWARSNHLPWSWRSEQLQGGDYANTAEIGLLALAWLAAYDLGQPWSPTWDATESEVVAILTQLRSWQTGAQTEQPNGSNAFNKSVFYQWYWVTSNPPVVGAGENDRLVPSIDNAWLAAALMTIRSYAQTHSHDSMTEIADSILKDMEFLPWYDASTHLFDWGAVNSQQGGFPADYYSNENRIINFVARALGQLSGDEYQASLAALYQFALSYESTQDGEKIDVAKVAYDGSYFTYLTPALFIKEMSEEYGLTTIGPATEAQIAYAKDQQYDIWGLSDCFDIADGAYLGQGAPPAVRPGSTETRPGLVTAHASALALLTPYASEASENLANIANNYPCAFDDDYGFYDSVLSGSVAGGESQCSYRFSALAQEWLFLALVNYHSDFIWRYFYMDPGVIQAHNEMFGYRAYLPALAN